LLLCENYVNNMQDEIYSKLTQYLEETLGVGVNYRDWENLKMLPHAIRRAYAFAEIRVLNEWFILFVMNSKETFSAATISKHLTWVEERTERRAIFVTDALEAYNRKRLIEQKVSFIVPGNQLYIPDLGLDLREQLRRIRETRKNMSPSAQVMLLAHLIKNNDLDIWTATGLSNELGFSKMTMGRAVDELINLELVGIQLEWRERRILFNDSKRTTWEAALPYFTSPIVSKVLLQDDPDIQEFLDRVTRDAGLTSLAKHSMLIPPNPPVKAISRKNWKALRENRNLRTIPKPNRDMAAVELEVWKYDPAVLSDSEDVDPLSLYLSLRHETDERVEQALEQMTEALPW